MEDKSDRAIIIPALVVGSILFFGVFFAFQSARRRMSTIVLPGGITYLGSTPSAAAALPKEDSLIPIPSDAKWGEYNGKLFPYAFSYPESLSLGWFPNDSYDSVTVFYQNMDANTNIFLRIEDLNKLGKQEYVGKPMEYVSTWWKDYNWKGMSSVTAFTNSKGLKGYRARYTNDSDQTPYDHVFFTVPGRLDLMIWISGKLFEQAIFDRIVDSATWK